MSEKPRWSCLAAWSPTSQTFIEAESVQRPDMGMNLPGTAVTIKET